MSFPCIPIYTFSRSAGRNISNYSVEILCCVPSGLSIQKRSHPVCTQYIGITDPLIFFRKVVQQDDGMATNGPVNIAHALAKGKSLR
jgi:hypothetical protein